jgi:hypothetical protein
MSEIPLLQQLFLAHTTDLLDVISDLDANLVPNVRNRVLCPICLVGYPEDAIRNGELTDGHVWPRDFRQRSAQAQTYRVLLCARCNHTSGSRGDAQMQIFKQVQDEETSGSYVDRRVQIAFGPDVRPVSLNASIVTTHTGDLPINAKIHLDLSRNDPKEMARFRDLSKGKNFSVIIPSHEGIKPEIAKVGWLTAAYLMAFHAFGYRYILHPWLNPVRQCILDSFDNNKPLFPESNVLQVRGCDKHGFQDPVVSVIVTPDGTHPVYVQVDFWDFHIRLPFHFSPDVFKAAIGLHMPDNFALPTGEGESLGIRVQCTKMNPHECIWDYVIGKPEPSL